RREVELAEALLKQREQDSDRYSGREDDPQVPRQLRQSRHRRPLPAGTKQHGQIKWFFPDINASPLSSAREVSVRCVQFRSA
ncbi:TPA: hypothetical protein NPI69_004845, partial [Escherichia coli]|nr:hypothetical protein [Escherichia coli]